MKNDKKSTNELQILNQNSVDYDCMRGTWIRLMYLTNIDKGKVKHVFRLSIEVFQTVPKKYTNFTTERICQQNFPESYGFAVIPVAEIASFCGGGALPIL